MLLYNHTLSIILILLFTGFAQYFSETKIQNPAAIQNTSVDQKQAGNLISQIDQLRSRIDKLRAQHTNLLPTRAYLIISTSDNEAILMKNAEILRRGHCSSGSYVLLKAPEQDGRQWYFRTPRGQFQVHMRLKEPSWYKPDWAYIEEGKPIPSIKSKERWQDDVLGKYALSFGPAFMIHGTLYKRFLGLPATHGCIRLDDDYIQYLYKKLRHGCKIFIY